MDSRPEVAECPSNRGERETARLTPRGLMPVSYFDFATQDTIAPWSRPLIRPALFQPFARCDTALTRAPWFAAPDTAVAIRSLNVAPFGSS